MERNTLVPLLRRSCIRAKFNSFIDRVGVWDQLLKPVEYLTDRFLRFVDYSELRFYQERDVDVEKCCVEQSDVRRLVKHWVEFQDSQRILVTTPSVLVGYRVKVYRAEGTTQWYTAVIVSYNDNTRELTVTDDTVLEEHNEDPCLVQMRLIGDGVVESILKGENVGITPRRRTCTLNSPIKVSHCATRTRYHASPASSQSSSPATTSSASSPRRGRNKPEPTPEPAPQEDAKGVLRSSYSIEVTLSRAPVEHWMRSRTVALPRLASREKVSVMAPPDLGIMTLPRCPL
ncbi:hypothetical protein HPB49_001624 [Dermacentor silvarum]|uniref:Uncharacterized protein n=1 Tax=Dermacentor silvarum TaxID=543639 RepID=A0ACB8DTJ4_DERSI|nr:hypothetical protein HPB49_001624 [Dermacentor silvarum]